MRTADDSEGETVVRNPRLRRAVGLTRWGMAVERLWPAIWQSAAVIGFFLAISLFDPWKRLPFWLHLSALSGCLVAISFQFRHALQIFVWPSEHEVARRLEERARLAHRPLEVLGDRPAGGMGSWSSAVWALHRRRAVADLGGIRPQAPRAGLQHRDPRAIRALLLITLLVGFLDAGSDWDHRLKTAFTPRFSNLSSALTAQALLTPPEYTGLSPQTLLAPDAPAPEGIGELIVPQGSLLSARIEGSGRAPALSFAGEYHRFDETDGAHEIEYVIDQSGELEIRAGSGLRARWSITALTDQPPLAAFRESPDATARGALRVEYLLQDDYGVAKVKLRMRRKARKDNLPLGEGPLDLELTGAETRNEPVRKAAFVDLTAHPWAGNPVEGQLIATDSAGQEGDSEKTTFLLPERIFTHPVARNLVYVRKSLFREPDRRKSAARRLDLQAAKTSDFQDDLSVFSALRSASRRLKRDDSERSLKEVTDILWDIALHLEDGQASVAERALRSAFDEAARMLENPNTPEGFDALAEQIARLMQDYLAAQIPASETKRPGNREMGKIQVIDAGSLNALLQQIQDLAAAGRSQEALELLTALRNMMENIAPAPMSAEEYRRLMEGAQAMNDLEGIRRQQRDLKDQMIRNRTLQALRPRLGDEGGDLSPQAQEQGTLKQALEEALQGLDDGDIGRPSAFGEAGSNMAAAQDALEKGDAQAAIRSQERVLDQLAKGIGELNRQLTSSMVRMGAGGAGVDPLGRPFGGDIGQIMLPRNSEVEAAQRILQELRDRLSDTTRPEVELDYIRRLLRRF